jgi:hypothetical protein
MKAFAEFLTAVYERYPWLSTLDGKKRLIAAIGTALLFLNQSPARIESLQVWIDWICGGISLVFWVWGVTHALVKKANFAGDTPPLCPPILSGEISSEGRTSGGKAEKDSGQVREPASAKHVDGGFMKVVTCFVLMMLSLLIFAAAVQAMPLINKAGADNKFVWLDPGAGVECKADQALEAGSTYIPVAAFSPVGYQWRTYGAPFDYARISFIATTGVTRIVKKMPHIGLTARFGDNVCFGVTTDFKETPYLYLDAAGGMQAVIGFLGGVIGVSP